VAHCVQTVAKKVVMLNNFYPPGNQEFWRNTLHIFSICPNGKNTRKVFGWNRIVTSTGKYPSIAIWVHIYAMVGANILLMYDAQLIIQ
jgi:hypothetical protein